FGQLFEPALRQRPFGAGLDFRDWQVEVFGAEGDFLAHGEGAPGKMPDRHLPDQLHRAGALGKAPFGPRPAIAGNRALMRPPVRQPAGKEVRERRLAAAVAAKDRKARTCPHLEADILEHRLVAKGKGEERDGYRSQSAQPMRSTDAATSAWRRRRSSAVSGGGDSTARRGKARNARPLSTPDRSCASASASVTSGTASSLSARSRSKNVSTRM